MAHSRTILGDFVELQRGTTYKSRLLGQPGPVLLGLATIRRNGGFRGGSVQTYGGECPAKLMVQPGELYASLKDVTQSADLLGAVARLPSGYGPGRLTQDTVKLLPKGHDVPLDYLYWLLRTPLYRSYCRSHATGTTNLGLPRNDFLTFPIPELTAIRRQSLVLLEALEAKVELNRRMNDTLEEIARAVFKSWFLDFEPVQAKMEGRDPGLPAEIASLFPDRLVGSEIGKIPDGWIVVSLDQMGRFLNGLAMQRFPPRDGPSLPVIKIAQLHSGNVEGADRASANLDKDYIVEDGDILFSWSGSLDCVTWSGGRGALNQHLFKVTSTHYPRWLLYLAIHHHLEGFRQIAAGKATTMGHIQRRHLAEAKMAVPPLALLHVSDGLISPLIESQWRRALESQTLARIRDKLLPKLTSGEIRLDVGREAVGT